MKPNQRSEYLVKFFEAFRGCFEVSRLVPTTTTTTTSSRVANYQHVGPPQPQPRVPNHQLVVADLERIPRVLFGRWIFLQDLVVRLSYITIFENEPVVCWGIAYLWHERLSDSSLGSAEIKKKGGPFV